MNEREMLSCREAIERLWAFIDGELESGEAESVRRHLTACERCHPHYDYQSAFCRFLKQRTLETAPPELRRRIFVRLLEEK